MNAQERKKTDLKHAESLEVIYLDRNLQRTTCGSAAFMVERVVNINGEEVARQRSEIASSTGKSGRQ